MQTPTRSPARPAASFAPYAMGVLTGAALALAGFTMMGQGYSRPTDPKPAGPAATPSAPAAAPLEADEYFVTAGNQSNTSARMWKRPAGRSTLEYVGEFQAAGRTTR